MYFGCDNLPEQDIPSGQYMQGQSSVIVIVLDTERGT